MLPSIILAMALFFSLLVLINIVPTRNMQATIHTVIRIAITASLWGVFYYLTH